MFDQKMFEFTVANRTFLHSIRDLELYLTIKTMQQ